MVTDYWLGRHSLTSATLQSVIEHCTAFNKDPWSSLTYIGPKFDAVTPAQGGPFNERMNIAWSDGHVSTIRWGSTKPHMWTIQDDKDAWTNKWVSK